MTGSKRSTVAGLPAQKGQRELTMLHVDTPDEAAAATAGIEFEAFLHALEGAR
jgi:hypothetical protein